MAQKQRNAPEKASSPGEVVAPLDKIARLLGILAIKGMEQKSDQVTVLRSAGFQISEVAAMLRMTDNHVRVASHTGRKKQRKATKKGSGEK